jgi:hypothetical protein
MDQPRYRSHRGAGALLTGLCLFASGVTGMAGCRTRATLVEEHTGDLEVEAPNDLKVVDYFPGDNVPGVPKDIQPYYFFNRAIDNPTELALALASAGVKTNIPFTYAMDFDNAGVTFIPGEPVYGANGDPSFDMRLEQGESALEASTFSTTFPTGLMFNISDELECTTFGGSSAQAKILNTYFEPGVYPLWIMVPNGVVSTTKLPVTTDLLLAPGYIRSSGTYRIYRHVGFSTVFHNVTIEGDGHFKGYEEGIFFPLDTPDKVVLTYMVKTSIEGTLDLKVSPPMIHDLKIWGVYPARSLLLLANESDSYAIAVNLVDLDVDLNGNGVNDSASFAATSQPQQIPPELWDP